MKIFDGDRWTGESVIVANVVRGSYSIPVSIKTDSSTVSNSGNVIVP